MKDEVAGSIPADGSMEELQKKVDIFIRSLAPQSKQPYWTEHELLAALTEEVGEVAREINAQFGPKPKKPDENPVDLAEELADVIVRTICIANRLELDLGEAIERKISADSLRDKERFLSQE